MDILIIGNGFDLAHGLSTQYNDFLEFIRCVRNCKLIAEIKKKSELENSPLILKKDYKELMELDFREDERSRRVYEIYNLSRDNIWINHFLNKQYEENKGWIDFETEISKVIQVLDYMRKMHNREIKRVEYRECPEKYDLEQFIFTTIDSRLREDTINDDTYRDVIIKKLVVDLQCMIRCLEIYLSDWVNKVDIEYISQDIKTLKIDKVLSFNYTNTYDRVYKGNIEHDFIHGNANAEQHMVDNNMVLGIDEYLVGEAKDKETDFIEFKKYFQRIHKETGCKYKEWVHNFIRGKGVRIDGTKRQNNIYIFGHSLDFTDKDVLKDLITQDNTITTIYYHNKDAYKERISNLVKIIGQDELINRVSAPNKTIIFKQQQDIVKIKVD